MTQLTRASRRYALASIIFALVAGIALSVADDAMAAGTLSITSASPAVFYYGRAATLKGQLTTESAATPYAIQIQSLSQDGVNWNVACTVPTDGSGRFSASVAPTRTATFRAVVSGDPSVVSRTVSVVPRIDLRRISGRASGKRTIQWVGSASAVVYGTSLPTSVFVTGDRLERGKWRRRATWRDPVFARGMLFGPAKVWRSDFTIMLKFPKKGKWRIRLASKRTATWGASVGPYKRVKVR